MAGTVKHEKIRRVAIAGASGYTGVELLRLLLQHPLTKVVALTAETYANQPIGKVFPSLAGFLDLTCLPLDTAKLAVEAEFVFLGLPHKTSMAVGADLIQRGTRVLDLSADYRLKDAAAYPRWYGIEHVAPHLLKEAAYGLPELHRAEIADARLRAIHRDRGAPDLVVVRGDRLDEQQLAAVQVAVLDGGDHLAHHAGQLHVLALPTGVQPVSRTASTIPTIAASAGLSGSGSALAASRPRT
jgi:hypothetical protein